LIYRFYLLFVVTATAAVHAAGTAMPWDSPLQSFLNNLTGPLAGAIALAAIVFGAGSLLLGGEWKLHATRPDRAAHQSSTVLSHSFVKPMFIVLLVLGVMLGAVNILALFGFISGAILPVGI